MHRGWLFGLAALAIFGIDPRVRASSEPPTSGGPTTFRRLNEEQYVTSIEDIFGAGVKVPGRFDPPVREEGLLAIGDGKAVVSTSGLEQDELRAREISAQVMSEDRRRSVLACAAPPADAFDETCASTFFTKYGRLLYRRPLSEAEMSSVLNVAAAATEQTHSFYKGLEIGLAHLLSSPNFIYRVERSEADPKNQNARRLSDYSLASRISFLLWNAPPDGALLDAAAKGELQKEGKLAEQVDRLITSPRFAQGVRAFFSDMFGYDQFSGLSKDQAIFPKYSSQFSQDAEEQTLRTIVELLVTNKGDYRELFTTRRTFMDRYLGSVYKVALDEPGVGGWQSYTFAPTDERAGILTLAAFLMLDPTHEGKTSPTIRGKSLRELFLCQKIPAPPGNVDFSRFEDPKNPRPTVRERLEAHRDNPVCAGCHSLTDPLGLAMENYDAIGSYRAMENGAAIDTNGTFDGKPYKTLIEFENILHDSSTTTSCVVQRAYEYGVGRQLTASERQWLKYADAQFAEDRYRFPALMRRIATSKAFQAVSPDYVASAN